MLEPATSLARSSWAGVEPFVGKKRRTGLRPLYREVGSLGAAKLACFVDLIAAQVEVSGRGRAIVVSSNVYTFVLTCLGDFALRLRRIIVVGAAL